MLDIMPISEKLKGLNEARTIISDNLRNRAPLA